MSIDDQIKAFTSLSSLIRPIRAVSVLAGLLWLALVVLVVGANLCLMTGGSVDPVICRRDTVLAVLLGFGATSATIVAAMLWFTEQVRREHVITRLMR